MGLFNDGAVVVAVIAGAGSSSCCSCCCCCCSCGPAGCLAVTGMLIPESDLTEKLLMIDLPDDKLKNRN